MKPKIMLMLLIVLIVAGFGGRSVDAVGIVNPGTTPSIGSWTMILIGTGLVWMAAYGRKKFRK